MTDKDTITLSREVVELALDALEWSWGGEPMGTKEREAITALREALAAEQPKPEPVSEAYRMATRRMTELLLDVLEWTYGSAPLYGDEKAALNNIRTKLRREEGP